MTPPHSALNSQNNGPTTRFRSGGAVSDHGVRPQTDASHTAVSAPMIRSLSDVLRSPRPAVPRRSYRVAPSPQALSMDPRRGSTTTTSSPARAPCSAVANPAGPTAGDEQVDQVRLASAAFSTLIRVLSSAALSTEKTSAVIQALCTSGSAAPSATTAT